MFLGCLRLMLISVVLSIIIGFNFSEFPKNFVFFDSPSNGWVVRIMCEDN